MDVLFKDDITVILLLGVSSMGPGVWSIKAVAVCGRESHGSGAPDKGQADHAKPNRSMPNPNHIRVGRDYIIIS